MAQQVENLYHEVINRVSQLDPLQKKKLSEFFVTQNQKLNEAANQYLFSLVEYLHSQNLDLQDAIIAYVKLCSEIRRESLLFAREKSYSHGNQELVNRELYSKPKEMQDCLLGLGLSQFLWPNHYALYSFYLDFLMENTTQFHSCLDIGPGHGAFLAASFELLPKAEHWAYDLSPTAVDFCKGLLSQLKIPKVKKVHWLNSDPCKSPPEFKFDFITLGEVIEHVDDPIGLLEKILPLLSSSGRVFITTCANCPAKDHVYLFRNIDEIRLVLRKSGFSIEQERIIELSPDLKRNAFNTINYAAILKRNCN